MRNDHKSGTGALDTAVESIRRRVPPGWSVDERPLTRRGGILTLTASDGRTADLALVFRQTVVPRDVPGVVAGAGAHALIISPYLGERTRALLAEAGASYADSTGNLRVVVSSPAIFLEGVGAGHDPDRAPRTLHSLKGSAAARVVRALCEFRPPFGVRTLAEASATPLGTVSRVVSFLETEALLMRGEKRQIVAVDCSALLSRWSTDYGVASSNSMGSYLEPLGLGALWPKLTGLVRYAVTGSVAGAGIAATRLAMIYVDNTSTAAKLLDLVPTQAGANVWLLEPYDDVVFERTRRKRVIVGTSTAELVTVSLPQAVVDLFTSPGRGPQEAQALLEHMKGTLDDWRLDPRS